MKEIKLFINGEFQTSDKEFISTNPANNEAVAKVYLPTEKDIDAAVDAAEAAFYSSEWRSMDQNKRAEILETIAEKLKGRIVNFFCTFGRVPFFYYILHLYLIHIIALIFAELSGFGWHKLILSTWISFDHNIKGYGFSLWVVYAVWLGAILILYPLCKMFDIYKQTHKEKWWLSYL